MNMIETCPSKVQPILPFKSVAVALIFSALLGPVGLLYATLWGGIAMIIIGFIVLSNPFWVPIILVWVSSSIWAVAATNRYNQKILKALREMK
jgi:hypothetical protein